MELFIDHINELRYFTESATDLEQELISEYKVSGIQHHKFYKMNNLCKMAWLLGRRSIDSLKKNISLPPSGKNAIILYNYCSSLASDWPHASMLSKGGMNRVSPSVFVYTLPNIANGELAIDLGWTGYTAFLIGSPEMDISLIYEQILMSFHQFDIDLALIGMIEVGTGIGEAYGRVGVVAPFLNSTIQFDLEKAKSLFLHG